MLGKQRVAALTAAAVVGGAGLAVVTTPVTASAVPAYPAINSVQSDKSVGMARDRDGKGAVFVVAPGDFKGGIESIKGVKGCETMIMQSPLYWPHKYRDTKWHNVDSVSVIVRITC